MLPLTWTHVGCTHVRQGNETFASSHVSVIVTPTHFIIPPLHVFAWFGLIENDACFQWCWCHVLSLLSNVFQLTCTHVVITKIPSLKAKYDCAPSRVRFIVQPLHIIIPPRQVCFCYTVIGKWRMFPMELISCAQNLIKCVSVNMHACRYHKISGIHARTYHMWNSSHLHPRARHHRWFLRAGLKQDIASFGFGIPVSENSRGIL